LFTRPSTANFAIYWLFHPNQPKIGIPFTYKKNVLGTGLIEEIVNVYHIDPIINLYFVVFAFVIVMDLNYSQKDLLAGSMCIWYLIK